MVHSVTKEESMCQIKKEDDLKSKVEEEIQENKHFTECVKSTES